MIVDISHGGSYAAGMAYYRIRNEREHRRAMNHVAAMGGPVPINEWERDDNVLISYEAAIEIIASNSPRKVKDFEDGWDVGIQIDRWEAFSHYGYDCGETFG